MDLVLGISAVFFADMDVAQAIWDALWTLALTIFLVVKRPYRAWYRNVCMIAIAAASIIGSLSSMEAIASVCSDCLLDISLTSVFRAQPVHCLDISS